MVARWHSCLAECFSGRWHTDARWHNQRDGELEFHGQQSVGRGLHPNLAFTNLNSTLAQFRQFTLQVGLSVVQNGGFESGDLSSWTLNGTTTSGGYFYNGVVDAGFFTDGSATNFIHSGLYGMAMGEVGTLAYLSQTLSTFPGQSYLLSFWMNNLYGETPNQFEVNWNTNTAATNTIFNQTNMVAINNWTNMLFILNATGTNTILQFGARNDNYYFGLDDISVWPVPNPSFRSISKVDHQFRCD